MSEQTVRVHFMSGEERIVPAKDFHWVGEEGARSATAIVDGREVPIYKRSESEWGSLWYEQAALQEKIMEEIENGIRITHEWLGRKQIIEAAYSDHRLNLMVDGKEVSLTEEETGYFLAWMATWYGEGE